MGYLVKAGHVAVLAEAVTTGKVPEPVVVENKKRFCTSCGKEVAEGMRFCSSCGASQE